MMRLCKAVLLLSLLSGLPLAAQEPQPPDPALDPAFMATFTITEKVKAEKVADSTNEFQGAGFGTGLGVVVDFDGGRVSDADVVNGVVRVKKDDDLAPRVLLNLHYFFSGACDPPKGEKEPPVSKWCRRAVIDGRNVPIPMRGFGPFVAVQPGSEETIHAVGGGFLWGWRRQPDQPDSFNVGFGFLVDQNVKVLGDGIEENKPLPEGEKEIRFKETSRWGFLLMASWAF